MLKKLYDDMPASVKGKLNLVIRSVIKSVYFFRPKGNKDGVNLIGFFSVILGIAEVGRFFAYNLIENKENLSIVDIEIARQKISEHELSLFQRYLSPKSVYHKNILFINAADLGIFEHRRYVLLAHHHNAAVFFWEFDDYFDFPEGFRLIDEVIVFSNFVATAVKKTAPENFKVTLFPFPFIKNWEIIITSSAIRETYGLRDDEFVFFFNFDFLSIVERKNPGGLIKAFKLAFPNRSDVKLILKTINAEKVPVKYDAFVSDIKNLGLTDNVILINGEMARNELMSVMNASDCYISFHRSEGFGIGMMEAMAMGKPVIATNYGGNTDFMNSENSFPVSFEKCSVPADALPYKEGWQWADPDLTEAAQYMSLVEGDKQLAKNIGDKAAGFISDNYSPAAFSAFYKNWLLS